MRAMFYAGRSVQAFGSPLPFEHYLQSSLGTFWKNYT